MIDRKEYFANYAKKNRAKINAYQTEWRNENRDKVNQDAKERRQQNPEKVKESLAKYRAANQDKVKAGKKEWNLKKYGLNQAKFDEIFVSQGCCCAICKCTEPNGQGTWKVDHDHKTGKVRGILCHHCNVSLGGFKDNIIILEAAITYLRKES